MFTEEHEVFGIIRSNIGAGRRGFASSQIHQVSAWSLVTLWSHSRAFLPSLPTCAARLFEAEMVGDTATVSTISARRTSSRLEDVA